MWIVDHWYLIVALTAIACVAVVGIVHFFQLPTEKQIANLKQWLLYAVIEAEKELDSGTGQLKLRQVYDWTLDKFPWIQFIRFETFSGWVDESLDLMREMLKKNSQVNTYVLGGLK